MSTSETSAQKKAGALVAVTAILVAIVGIGLLLQEYGPGNMGNGFLQGAGVGLLGAGVMFWRVWRRPESTTSFERAFTSSGDERDDALLTQTLAVMGLAAVLLTGAAAVAIGLGVHAPMVAFFLLVSQLAVGVVAYAVIARRN